MTYEYRVLTDADRAELDEQDSPLGLRTARIRELEVELHRARRDGRDEEAAELEALLNGIE